MAQTIKTVNIKGLGVFDFVKRQNIKNLRITIKPNENIRVSIPYRIHFDSAMQFVLSKEAWIRNTVSKVNSRAKQQTVYEANNEYKTFANTIKIQSYGYERVILKKVANQYYIFVPQYENIYSPEIQNAIKEGFIHVYRLEAKEYLPKRTAQLAEEHGFKYNNISIKNAKTRWGSCSGKNNINLNLHLMRLPHHLIDYVILHELVHTVHKNHGPNFWDHLDLVCNGKAQLYEREMKAFSSQLF